MSKPMSPLTPTPAELERYYTKGIQEFWNQYGFTSLLAITPADAAAGPAKGGAVKNAADHSLHYLDLDLGQWQEHAR